MGGQRQAFGSLDSPEVQSLVLRLGCMTEPRARAHTVPAHASSCKINLCQQRTFHHRCFVRFDARYAEVAARALRPTALHVVLDGCEALVCELTVR